MNRASGRGIESAVSTIGRLRRRSEFLAVASGRRFHTEHLTAQGRLRPLDAEGVAPQDESALRLGFTITKRVGHATERNRIRRRLRAAVLAAAETLPVRAADVVLVARRPALHAPFETLIEDLRRAVAVVTKPPSSSSSKTPASSAPRSGRGRGKGAPASGVSTAPPLLDAPEALTPGHGGARAPSPQSNACDGPTDG